MSDGRLMIRRLDTPPGDDRLAWRGIVTLPYPFTPPLDPMNKGVRLLLRDGNGTIFTDVTLPAGAYDPGIRRGWLVSVDGRVFTYKQVGDLVPLIGGIRKVVIRDYSNRSPGRLKFTVTGREGAFAGAALPLHGTFVFDSPLAATGQCAEHAFPGPAPAPFCTSPVTDLIICR